MLRGTIPHPPHTFPFSDGANSAKLALGQNTSFGVNIGLRKTAAHHFTASGDKIALDGAQLIP